MMSAPENVSQEQLNSRAPTLDGYFSAQQIVQGMV